MSNISVDRRLFLTADKDRLVNPDDPAAAFLWAGEGDEVTEEEAERVGYKAGKKSAAPAEDKAVAAPAEDKASGVKINRRSKADG